MTYLTEGSTAWALGIVFFPPCFFDASCNLLASAKAYDDHVRGLGCRVRVSIMFKSDDDIKNNIKQQVESGLQGQILVAFSSHMVMVECNGYKKERECHTWAISSA